MSLFKRRRQLTCRRAVELISSYLDDALPIAQQRELERHLEDCPHCAEYLRQLRVVITATGRIDTDDLSPETVDALISVYRKTTDRST